MIPARPRPRLRPVMVTSGAVAASGRGRLGGMRFSSEDLSWAAGVVGRRVPPTPQYVWPLLAEYVGAEGWVKHENHTPTGAFEVRGGRVYAERLRTGRPGVKGIVSATRGNHGQSLAFAGRAAGIGVTIVVPEGNSPDKNAAMRGFGAELIVHGRDYQSSREYASELGAQRGLEAVPAFHPDLVLGVATYARELFGATGELDTVYVPVGMGSGICGIVGVLAAEAPATALSFESGRVVTTETSHTFVDGVAARVPDADAMATIKAGAARILTISEDDAAQAMRVLFSTTHNVPEPAGALALAGLLAERSRAAGKRVGVIQTGGNIDTGMLLQVLAGQTPTV